MLNIGLHFWISKLVAAGGKSRTRVVGTRRSPADANSFDRQSVRFVDHLPPLHQIRDARILYTPAGPLKITPQPRRQVTAPFLFQLQDGILVLRRDLWLADSAIDSQDKCV